MCRGKPEWQSGLRMLQIYSLYILSIYKLFSVKFCVSMFMCACTYVFMFICMPFVNECGSQRSISAVFLYYCTVGSFWSCEWMCAICHGHGRVKDSNASNPWQLQGFPWLKLKGMAKLSWSLSMNVDSECRKRPLLLFVSLVFIAWRCSWTLRVFFW